jgi:hypothetical protein
VGHMSLSIDSSICQEAGRGVVEFHPQAIPTPSRTTDSYSTWTPKILPRHTR